MNTDMAEIKISSLTKQRILGLLLFLLGLSLTVWFWVRGVSGGYIYINASMLFPAFMIMGIGFLIFPIDPMVMKKKWGVEKIENVGQIPGIWWIILILSILIGIGNYFLLSSH